jgi:hypothetical protein
MCTGVCMWILPTTDQVASESKSVLVAGTCGFLNTGAPQLHAMHILSCGHTTPFQVVLLSWLLVAHHN